jgi:hypothetical protein
MKLAIRCSVLFSALACLTSVPVAQAGKPDQPKSVDELKSYEFEEKCRGDECTVWIEDDVYGRIGDGKDGYIRYHLACWKNKRAVHIDMIEGVKGTKGVGKMLKKELLRRYPKRSIKSELVEKNEDKLLRVWAKDFPHKKNEKSGKKFLGVVPATSFEGFHYIITPIVHSSGIGGAIELEMKAARRGKKGSIYVTDPIALDKILATSEPEMIDARDRPMSEKELKKQQRDNENAAKKAADMVEKLAKKVSRDEDVKEKDLEEHIKDLLDDSCGRGGSSGSGWADGCLFTKKGSSYVVKHLKSGSSFYLNKWMDDTVEDFLKS